MQYHTDRIHVTMSPDSQASKLALLLMKEEKLSSLTPTEAAKLYLGIKTEILSVLQPVVNPSV